MKAYVLDLEMNQPSEAIIQIGLVTVDLTTRLITDSLSVHVNPHEPLSQEISELTGITQDDLDRGIELDDALGMVWDRVRNGVQVAWGRDWHLLRMSAAMLSGRAPPIRWRVVDLKGVAQILGQTLPNSSRKKVRGLRSTLEAFGLEFVGRQHDALVDARNTANLMVRMMGMVDLATGVEGLVSGNRLGCEGSGRASSRTRPSGSEPSSSA